MKIYNKEIKELNVQVGLICDVCKTEVRNPEEVIQINHSCGYSSVFGDLNTLKLDICQYCFKDKFHKHVIIEEYV